MWRTIIQYLKSIGPKLVVWILLLLTALIISLLGFGTWESQFECLKGCVQPPASESFIPRDEPRQVRLSPGRSTAAISAGGRSISILWGTTPTQSIKAGGITPGRSVRRSGSLGADHMGTIATLSSDIVFGPESVRHERHADRARLFMHQDAQFVPGRSVPKVPDFFAYSRAFGSLEREVVRVPRFGDLSHNVLLTFLFRSRGPPGQFSTA